MRRGFPFVEICTQCREELPVTIDVIVGDAALYERRGACQSDPTSAREFYSASLDLYENVLKHEPMNQEVPAPSWLPYLKLFLKRDFSQTEPLTTLILSTSSP